MARKRWITAAAIAGAVLIALLTGWFAYRYGARYCTAMKAANFAKEAKDRIAPIDCLEFWVNRYQTLVAAVLAVAAAYFSIRATREQTATSLRTSENTARVVLYDAIRAFARAAFEHLQSIDRFDHGTLAVFDRPPPCFEMGEEKALIAHLPTRIARAIIRFERETAGLQSNRELLLRRSTPIVHQFTRCRLANFIIDAEALAQELGSKIDIFDAHFGSDIWADILAAAELCPSTENGEEVVRWLEALADARRKTMVDA